MASKPLRLSKSRVQSGAQCPLKLWYDCFERDLAPPVDEVQQFIFDRGTRIGLLAQERYPGGKVIDAEYYEIKLALQQTEDAILDSAVSTLFEPAFLHQNVLARIDVLQRVDDERWDILEVKGATNQKDVYVRDLAIQLWIARGAGLRVRRAGLLLLNKEYVYDGKRLDLDQLFTFVDLTGEALVMQHEIDALVASLQEMLAEADPPQIAPGGHCSDPYDCPYYATCSKGYEFPEHPVESLPRILAGKRAQLAELGVAEIQEIPADFALNDTQARVRDCVITGKDWASAGLAGALADIAYPVHHLDFEAFMPAIPLYAQTRPFETVPFQYSIHRESKQGKLQHLEYLCTSGEDPQRELAEHLLSDLGTRGSICVYSPYENRIISALAERFPDLREPLEGLLQRLWDLLPIVRGHYYHPGFHGSFSIKSVLPVLVPEMSYDDMEIGDGLAAAAMYESTFTVEDEAARNQIYENLRTYCAQDTIAMVELRRAFARRVQ